MFLRNGSSTPPLARWCHRHRLAVALAWVGLLIERQVMTLVATGLSNDDFAERLFVTPVTVKTHANRARARLGARDRAQLVVMAYESGLVRARETR